MHERIPPSHIVVGLSGGVDSTIAAFLLKKAGHHISAVFMKNWQDESDEFCPAAQDLADAERVCDQLKIDLTVVNFADQYWEHVFSHFLNAYQAGLTPNPDILCNKEIKFSAFLNYAKKQGADYIATGHYARLAQTSQSIYLQKARDSSKDQSYFLHALTPDALLQTLFPLGEITKKEVRALAESLQLVNHNKKIVPAFVLLVNVNLKAFLSNYLPANPGEIVTLENEVLGEHDGLMFYTIGQRQGLKIGGRKNKSEAAWYVAAKNLAENKLVVVQGANHPVLFKQTLYVDQMHWINDAQKTPTKLHAKTRYRQLDQACTINSEGKKLKVNFDEPQRALTPGQYLVLYQDDICLGGGIIEI